MSSFVLRLLALSTMVCDHIGYALLPQVAWLRMVGRISFPLYCFLLAQGFRHTRNVSKYALRLALFALLSEIPYNLVFYRGATLPTAHNVFFSLLLALGALVAYARFSSRDPFWALTCILAACATAIFVKCDYSFWGILLSVCFYAAGENRLRLALGFAAAMAVYLLFRLELRTSPAWVMIQALAALALLPILLYNGKPGFRGGKWLFYLLYPAHLLVFAYWKDLSLLLHTYLPTIFK